ncbi:hypothetical protein [Haladaptatus litoreus]|nr:hypothetical protein [Haladaptatus litoreus]
MTTRSSSEWPACPDDTRFVESALRMNRVVEVYVLPDTIDSSTLVDRE